MPGEVLEGKRAETKREEIVRDPTRRDIRNGKSKSDTAPYLDEKPPSRLRRRPITHNTLSLLKNV